jgi:5-methylcytosine-specific restriction endonuclease McrA
MAKPTVSLLKKKIMILIKAHVKRRDKHVCQHCGKSVSGHDEQASHVKPTSHYQSLMFDPINIKVLCYRCHNWWHENPTDSAEWFKTKFPDRWVYIQEHQNEIPHWKINDYREMLEQAKSL